MTNYTYEKHTSINNLRNFNKYKKLTYNFFQYEKKFKNIVQQLTSKYKKRFLLYRTMKYINFMKDITKAK